jgi:hypothetical protein
VKKVTFFAFFFGQAVSIQYHRLLKAITIN